MSLSNSLRFYLHYSALLTFIPQRVLGGKDSAHSKSFLSHYSSHVLAGLAACVATYPLDVWYTRRGTRGDSGLIQSPIKQGSSSTSSSASGSIIMRGTAIFSHLSSAVNSVKSLYSGLSVCLVAYPLGLLVSLGSLSVMEKVLGADYVHTYPSNVIVGSAAACSGALLTYPLDTMRRRMIVVRSVLGSVTPH